MKIRRFQPDNDMNRLEDYLRERYALRKDTVSWLPERLHDLVYRVSAQETERGEERSMDHIYLWEENEEIVACILPDGENIYFSLREDDDALFEEMLTFSEKKCLPLFRKAEDGSTKFWTAVDSGLGYMQEALIRRGYQRYQDESYENAAYPQELELTADLPEGYALRYGEEYENEENKWGAHHLGFHSDDEGTDAANDMSPYHLRKKSSLYPDSFECIVTDEKSGEENDVCSYCFVYVDHRSKSTMIEPVSTRERYRHQGIGTAMMHGVLMRCKELGIEKCYVESFGSRREFYNAAGFETEGSTVFWHRILIPEEDADASAPDAGQP